MIIWQLQLEQPCCAETRSNDFTTEYPAVFNFSIARIAVCNCNLVYKPIRAVFLNTFALSIFSIDGPYFTKQRRITGTQMGNSAYPTLLKATPFDQVSNGVAGCRLSAGDRSGCLRPSPHISGVLYRTISCTLGNRSSRSFPDIPIFRRQS